MQAKKFKIKVVVLCLCLGVVSTCQAKVIYVDADATGANDGTLEDANDDFWVNGDYHLKSQAGRWDVNDGRSDESLY